MKRSGVIILLILLSIACTTVIPIANSTPEPITGSISGNVLDENGSLVPLVSIVTEPPTSAVTTDEQGNYSIPKVPPGNYIVTLVKSGYTSTSVQVAVVAGKTTTTDLHLLVRPTNTPPAPTIEASLTTSLVAYYPLDGTAEDASGNGHHGTVHGATWTAGKVEQALSFDGSDDYVRMPLSLALSGDMTIEAWVRTSAAPAEQGRILDLARSASRGLQISMTADGRIGIDNSGGPSSGVWTSSAYDDGNWHHIAVVREGNNYQVYVGGEKVDSTRGTVPVYTQLFLGRVEEDWGYWSGYIDQVRVWNVARTQSEIQALALQ